MQSLSINTKYLAANIVRFSMLVVVVALLLVEQQILSAAIYIALAFLAFAWLLLEILGVIETEKHPSYVYFVSVADIIALSGLVYLGGTYNSFFLMTYVFSVAISSTSVEYEQGRVSLLSSLICYFAAHHPRWSLSRLLCKLH